MITSAIITRRADRDGVPAPTVERDYVLTHILAGIASQVGAERMVFKGGTALRLCWLDNYRYSADLDFSLIDGLTANDAQDLVTAALDAVAASIGFPLLTLTDDPVPRIAYRGPLGRQRTIKLDLADDELTDTPILRPLLARYSDQPVIDVSVYDLPEVTAEKLRCIIQRVQCRDFFDLHELFVNQGIPAAEVWDLFEKKTRHKGLDPAIFPVRFDDRIERYRNLWMSELEDHVADEPPPFDAVERAVRRALRSQLRR